MTMKNPENWDMFEAFTVVVTFSGLFQQCDSKQPQHATADSVDDILGRCVAYAWWVCIETEEPIPDDYLPIFFYVISPTTNPK